jgi:hypothetical protein
MLASLFSEASRFIPGPEYTGKARADAGAVLDRLLAGLGAEPQRIPAQQG